MGYYAGEDQGNGTGFQTLSHNLGSGGDESCSGELHLFNPASTTYAKNFYGTMTANNASNESSEMFAAGYINVAAAITEVQFKMDSGNFDGIIMMYGVL